MSSSASLPSPDDDYAAPLDARLNKAFWDAALVSVGARVRALEAVKADWEELINQGTGQALAVIQANVEPQLAALTAVINQLKAEVAAAEDAIAVIIAGGVNMSAVTGLADALAAKASLSALNGAVSALTLSMDDYVSHAEAQTLTAEQKAQALSNLGLEDIHKTLTPFGFTATAGQTTFALGMSPLPSACIFSLNGAWLTGGGVDYAVAGSTLTLATPAEAGDRIAGVAIAPFMVANAMLSAANLADLANAAVARANLGLGSAAILNAGTGANQLLKLDAAAKIPPVDGSQITGLPFSKEWNSGELALNAATVATLAHTLGTKPKILDIVLVCKTAEYGYSVDDEYREPGVLIGPNNSPLMTFSSSASSITYMFQSNTNYYIMHKTTRAWSEPTFANWRLKIRAFA